MPPRSRARPARAAASRPGSLRHRHFRRASLPFRAPDGPGGRHLLPPRSDRAPARHRRRSAMCAIRPPARPSCATSSRCSADLDGGGFAVGHNGNLTNGLRCAASWWATARSCSRPPTPKSSCISSRSRAQPLRRPLHRRAAPGGRRLFAGRADQQEADRRARSAWHPAAGDGRSRRRADPGLGNLRPRHHRRPIRARHRDGRDGGVQRGRHRIRICRSRTMQPRPASSNISISRGPIRSWTAAPSTKRARRMGAELAHEAPAAADVVMPVPDSACRPRSASRRSPASPSSSASSAITMSGAPSSSRRSRSAISACG